MRPRVSEESDRQSIFSTRVNLAYDVICHVAKDNSSAMSLIHGLLHNRDAAQQVQRLTFVVDVSDSDQVTHIPDNIILEEEELAKITALLEQKQDWLAQRPENVLDDVQGGHPKALAMVVSLLCPNIHTLRWKRSGKDQHRATEAGIGLEAVSHWQDMDRRRDLVTTADSSERMFPHLRNLELIHTTDDLFVGPGSKADSHRYQWLYPPYEELKDFARQIKSLELDLEHFSPDLMQWMESNLTNVETCHIHGLPIANQTLDTTGRRTYDLMYAEKLLTNWKKTLTELTITPRCDPRKIYQSNHKMEFTTFSALEVLEIPQDFFIRTKPSGIRIQNTEASMPPNVVTLRITHVQDELVQENQSEPKVLPIILQLEHICDLINDSDKFCLDSFPRLEAIELHYNRVEGQKIFDFRGRSQVAKLQQKFPKRVQLSCHLVDIVTRERSVIDLEGLRNPMLGPVHHHDSTVSQRDFADWTPKAPEQVKQLAIASRNPPYALEEGLVNKILHV